jgi:DNA-binding CsgD family transcriptional regulator
MKTENEAYNFSNLYPEVINVNSLNPDLLSIEKTLKHNHRENDLQHFFGYCLIDYSGKQFACIHEHCKDFCSRLNNELLDGNQDFHPLHFHPSDRKIWCELAIPDIRKFMDSIPFEEFPDYRFSFNHRYFHKDGSVSQFLHEGSLAFSEDTGQTVLNLEVFTEIGDIKPDASMVLTILRYSAEMGYQKVFSKVYLENQDVKVSTREIEIIKLCLEGLSSKMIARKLNISVHTVKNHKRNSMEKTHTHTMAELINLCIRSRWI